MRGDEPATMDQREMAAEAAFHRDLQKQRDSHEVIAVEKSLIPKDSKLAECYETAKGFYILGDPDDFPDHNCDAMGCRQGHVIAIVLKQEATR